MFASYVLRQENKYILKPFLIFYFEAKYKVLNLEAEEIFLSL